MILLKFFFFKKIFQHLQFQVDLKIFLKNSSFFPLFCRSKLCGNELIQEVRRIVRKLQISKESFDASPIIHRFLSPLLSSVRIKSLHRESPRVLRSLPLNSVRSEETNERESELAKQRVNSPLDRNLMTTPSKRDARRSLGGITTKL